MIEPTNKNQELQVFEKYSNELTTLIYSMLNARPELYRDYEAQPYQQQELNDFTYGQNGPEFTGSSFKAKEKRSWIKSCFLLSRTIFQSPDYILTEKYLQDQYGHANTQSWFQQYHYQLIKIACASPNDQNNPSITALNTKLINSLSQAELPTFIKIELNGLILESKEIALADGMILRQSVKSDFEKPVAPLRSDFFSSPRPTAVLEHEGKCKLGETISLRTRVKTTLYQLQLFFTCSLQLIIKEIEQESITTAKSSGSNEKGCMRIFAPQTILSKDEGQLISFLQKLKLPKQILSSASEHKDYLSTAFDRYLECLSEDVVFERRVASAIMGIEALLSSEKQELSFRIQTRSARLLSLFDQMGALKIRSFLATAYAVRSNYAHGGFLEKKQKEKIIRDFDTLDGYARTVIGFLRKLLVIFIAAEVDKAFLLPLIDDSLVDEQSLGKLKTYTMVAASYYR